ncbi:MAG: serine/threonine protein kinase [Archangiaceae bacterium]|nr:serine/threonine protein kinase [Archangiaceae bacterium]
MPPVAGRYKALRKIADGGTAEVFLAEQVGAAGFRRLVVLKRIRDALYADQQFRRILIDEAHVTMGLHHSNLVEVLDLGEAQGRYFLVLELVDGWTLQQLLERARDAHHPVPPEMAVYLLTEVCRALGYAHDRTRAGVRLNIVHRDVCPNNVLVSDSGEVKLADFGIAKARIRTSTSAIGTVAGKPSYMSPEQASGEPLDARSDLFSAGTLLYYLLTGELPFRAPNERELMVRVASGEFIAPNKVKGSLPKELTKLVLEAMKRDPAQRFQSAQEMIGALEKVQRSALPPFGRTELEAWLRALNKKDGQVPVTRESMIPAPAPKPSEPEWIELSPDQLKSAPPAAPAPAPYAVSPRKPEGLGLWVVALAALAIVGVGVWAYANRDRFGAPPEVARRPPLLPDPIPVKPPEPEPAPVPVPVPAPEPAPEVAESAVPDAAVEPEPAPAPAEPEPEPAPAPEPVAVPAPVKPAELPPLKVWGKLSPSDTKGDRLGVALDSDPQGAKVLLDGKQHLGTTPTVLRFKAGIPFALTFAHDGYAPNVKWLMLVERPDKPPRFTLSVPPSK